jgi:TonB-dependent SusC/RagA subfamily outer membrane receptor
MSHSATLRFVKAGAALVLATVTAGSCATTSGAGDNSNVASDEVQIGYGSQERAEVTGAVVSVRVADLGREITSFEDLFQGVAGVTVRRLASGGISIRIRGSSSLSGDAEPLYVINGVPIRAPPGQALMGVNPREVTRIDVLKDAGATSIYGSRGANGVILIFTEREEVDPKP